MKNQGQVLAATIYTHNVSKTLLNTPTKPLFYDPVVPSQVDNYFSLGFQLKRRADRVGWRS